MNYDTVSATCRHEIRTDYYLFDWYFTGYNEKQLKPSPLIN